MRQTTIYSLFFFNMIEMAKVRRAAKSLTLTGHDYYLMALREACDEEEVNNIEAIEEENLKMLHDHTPLPSPNSQKMKPKTQDTNKQPDK